MADKKDANKQEKAPKKAPQGGPEGAAKQPKKAKGEPKASKGPEVATGEGVAFPAGYVPRLRLRYKDEIAPALKATLGIKNVMAVPRITKVVINMGLGKAITEKPRLEAAVKELTLIAGQKAQVCKARISVSNFKLRQGMEIGCRVTLRGNRMWEFLDRLINLAIPRVKDFRGLNPKAFDQRGNYNMGLTEQTVFPEIRGDNVTFHQGMNITIVTTAGEEKAAFELLKAFGMPFATADAAKKAS